MRIFTGKALPRRTFLQGMGAAVALPYLDAMEPAFRGLRKGGAAASSGRTRLVCIENLDQAGGCYYNYACAYTDTISWASPSEPLPMIRNPRAAFDLLFGAGKDNADRVVRRQANSSILDWIMSETAGLKRQLGAADQQRVDKYLEDIRELERRIQKVEARNASGAERELPEAPLGVADSFWE